MNGAKPTTFFALRASLAVTFLAGAGEMVSAQPTTADRLAVQTLQQIKTVFVIALENHDWTQVCPECNPQQLLGNPAAPYLNSLVTTGNPNAAQVSYATAYYGLPSGVHPSEPNYIWSEAGTNFGSCTDNDPNMAWGNLFNTRSHLCAKLNSQGIAWKDYQEDLEYTSDPGVSSVGARPDGTNIYNGSAEYSYLVKHNPMQFFLDTQGQNMYPLTQFWNDLSNNAVGRYNWITPDEFNEMHSCLPNGFTYQGVQFIGNQAAIAEGDNFLATVIPQIMASAAYQDHGAIIIWMDETESTDDTNTALPEIIISPLAKGNAYASSVPMNHSSDLKTMGEIFGLGSSSDPAVNDLSDMFQAPSVEPVIPQLGQKIFGPGGFTWTFSGPAGHAYQVLASSYLTVPVSAWTVAGSGIFSGTNIIFSDSNAVNAPQRFYTIKLP